jgi:peroxiredoxin
MKSPFHFRAEHRGEGNSILEVTVYDEKTVRVSSNGETQEGPAFASGGSGAMIVLSNAGFDVPATWHLLLDQEYLRKAIASGKILFLWQGEIEDDLCNVVLYAHNEVIDYWWISAKTALPRAVQRVNMMRGHNTSPGPRFEISNVRFNPEIPPNAFAFAPPSSGARTAEYQGTPPVFSEPTKSILGQPLPSLEVRDPQYHPLALSDLTGKSTLVTFWAPWCVGCVEELAALQKLQSRFHGQYRAVAIAVQDKRLNALKFIQEHSEYTFQFFTDPDMEDEASRLGSFFGLATIPVSLFVGSQGKIVDQWVGFDGEEELSKRLTELLGQPRQ